MLVAVFLLVCAAVILFYNTSEDDRVSEETINTVTKIEELIENNNMLLEENETNELNSNEIKLENVDINSSIGSQSSTKIDGITYIGIIYIPSLNNLAVPIIDECTETNLKLSACRYAGKLENNNIVIAGHNYKSLFGKLSKLALGNVIYFKDLEGNAHKYKCTEIVTLSENDVEKMQTGNWDLTIFTCTYNGNERLTFRFERTT